MRFWVLLFTILTSSLVLAQSKPKHHIFFIHGIGGNEKTFGVMPEATAHHLQMLDTSQEYHAYRFVYQTADQSFDTNDFAVQFGEFINTTLQGEIGDNDKISIVAHSQGGLVGLIWYFHAYLDRLKKNSVQMKTAKPEGGLAVNYYSKYSLHMDAIITIGTPFWGSKLATFLISDSQVGQTAQRLGKAVIEKMGRRQLEEMALGSRTIINFRKNVTQIPDAVLYQMRDRLRPVNIAGAARLDQLFSEKSYGLSMGLGILKDSTFGGRYFESDIAVPVPSAHFDSIYSLDNSPNYVEGQVSPITMTYKTQFAPLTILNTMHASPWAEEVYDMAYVPSKCMEDLNCDHPTFRYVVNHMLGKTLPRFGNGISADELAGFTLSVRVNFPEGVDAQNIKVKIEKITDKKVDKKVGIVMANSREVLSNYDFYHPNYKNVLFRTFTGHMDYAGDEGISPEAYAARKNGVPLRLLIQAQGYKTRYVDTTLQPTFSTYVETTLEKK